MTRLTQFAAISILVLWAQVSAATPMRTFLTSCAYGAGAGALAGVTALAFSDRPSENLSSVARGASLGLYVGMGVGLYMISQPDAASDSSWKSWVAPTPEGLQAGLSLSF